MEPPEAIDLSMTLQADSRSLVTSVRLRVPARRSGWI